MKESGEILLALTSPRREIQREGFLSCPATTATSQNELAKTRLARHRDAMVTDEIPIGKFSLGKVPLVVGTVSSSEFLSNAPNDSAEMPCDLLEIRLDHIPHFPWQRMCDSIEGSGLPVLLTIRLENEGGNWKAPDRDRLPLFKEAFDHVSMVDVELKSQIAKEVAGLARKKGKRALASYHDFTKTPPLSHLKKILGEAREFAQAAKVSTMIQRESDIGVLRSLLEVDWGIPICVIGMGPLGTRTRVEFPAIGSCLTYGYLDKPSAPGQLSAAELRAQVRARSSLALPGF